jgi:hypothetical protein
MFGNAELGSQGRPMDGQVLKFFQAFGAYADEWIPASP